MGNLTRIDELEGYLKEIEELLQIKTKPLLLKVLKETQRKFRQDLRDHPLSLEGDKGEETILTTKKIQVLHRSQLVAEISIEEYINHLFGPLSHSVKRIKGIVSSLKR